MTRVYILAVMALALLAQPPKLSYFSVSGNRATFHEDNIEKIEVVVSSAQSQGRMSMIESNWLPNFAVPAHYHKTHSETFYVLSGQVEWTVGGEARVLKAGDSVHIPPNTVHSVKVVGNQKMHSIMIQEPGGYEERAADAAATYTPAQRKDTKVIERLRKMDDFHPVR